jgi:hypothetical protein
MDERSAFHLDAGNMQTAVREVHQFPQGVIRTARFSLRGGPNFLVLVVHRIVPAELATRKSDGFVLIGKRSHRLAARPHDPSCSRQ